MLGINHDKYTVCTQKITSIQKIYIFYFLIILKDLKDLVIEKYVNLFLIKWKISVNVTSSSCHHINNPTFFEVIKYIINQTLYFKLHIVVLFIF